MTSRSFIAACTLTIVFVTGALAPGAELLVGAASVDITPEKPAALAGQFHLRISTGIETPISVNAIAVESHNGERSLDQAIMVSCDVVVIPSDVLSLVRTEVTKLLPELDTTKIFLFATHTHTAPELRLGRFILPKDGVVQVEEYRNFFANKVATAVANAWNARAPGSMTWGLSHAVIAHNRRAVYENGSARMYGPTDVPTFRGMEGYEDHDIGTLFFWNKADKLIAIAVNVSCPSQEVESRRAVNADYWHPVRQSLKERYGDDVCVVGMCGAAGDSSPHLMYRKAADERMRRLRGLDRLDEIARRIVRAVDEAYEVVKDDRHADIPIVHKVETVQLPMRLVKDSELAEAQAEYDRAAAKIKANPDIASAEHRRMKWYEGTIDRYKRQQSDAAPTLPMELHVLRIGDAVICTNQFELFTDFGIRIKGRSKAVQTFVVQLTGPGTYLPTAEAVRGGHYSAVVHSSHVGPEGGQVLVDKTVELIDEIWANSK